MLASQDRKISSKINPSETLSEGSQNVVEIGPRKKKKLQSVRILLPQYRVALASDFPQELQIRMGTFSSDCYICFCNTSDFFCTFVVTRSVYSLHSFCLHLFLQHEGFLLHCLWQVAIEIAADVILLLLKKFLKYLLLLLNLLL